VAGSLVGTYFPRSDPAHRLHEALRLLLKLYPAWAHLPLLAFLFLLFFRPAADLIRRYRHNWQTDVPFFTIVDGCFAFIFGWVSAALLNGSLPHSISGYSAATAAALTVWGSAFILFLITILVFSYASTKVSPLHPKSDDLIDAPITEDTQDILGRLGFVEDFHKQIKRFPSEDSFVFGLNGPWGSGKTSVLNLLKNRLRSGEDTILVEFNPWYFQSPETITRRFYENIAQAINRQFFYPQLRPLVRRYARILAPVLKRYGIEFIDKEDSTVEEMKETVESYILHTGKRVVVVIDDLERAHENELLTVFQIVRLSANFKKTLFVLSYDQAQLLPQLDRLGVSRDFLGKIVQQPVDLPAADKNEIDRFVIYSDSEGHKSQIDKLLDKLPILQERRKSFDTKSVELYLGTLSPFFSTLRDAKRFLTSFSVRLSVVVDEVNLIDFFLLEVLRVFANNVFQDIWNNPHYYVPGWTMKSLMGSPFGLDYDDRKKEFRREEIRKHVDNTLKNERHRDNLLKILKELFPARISDAFGRPATYGDNAASRFRAEKRLTHPDSFQKYFLLSVPKGVIPDAEVEGVLSSWRDAEERENKIFEDLTSLTESQKLVEVLNRILIFLGRIDNGVIEPLLKALSLHLDSVPLDGDNSQQSAQLKLIIFLLSERVAGGEKQGATETTIKNIRFIDVAVRLVQWLSDEQEAVTWGLQRFLDIARIKKAVFGRFVAEFVRTGKDIFVTNENPLFVLYQIGSYDAESRQTINNYVSDLLGRESKYIGKLIDAFLIEIPDYPGNGFQMDRLKAVYKTSNLTRLALQAGDRAWANEKQKRAVEMFLGAVDRLEPDGPEASTNPSPSSN
jgi:predicted KAP-like P-loop ATPase